MGRKEGQRMSGTSPFLFTNWNLPCPSARLLAVAARGPISWEVSEREAFLVRPSLHCNTNTSASRNHTATIYWLFALCILWIALHLILNKSSMTNFIVCSQLHGETGYTEIEWLVQNHGWWVTKLWNSNQMHLTLKLIFSPQPPGYHHVKHPGQIRARLFSVLRPRLKFLKVEIPTSEGEAICSPEAQEHHSLSTGCTWCALEWRHPGMWPIKSPTLSGPKARLTHPSRYHFKAQNPWALT